MTWPTSRVAWLLACVLLAPAVLAAPRPTRREQIQFAIWYAGDEDGLQPVKRIIRSAQSKTPGLSVCLRRFDPGFAYRQVQQWCRPGALGVPDVIILRDLWLPAFAGHFEPLSAHLSYHRHLRQYPASIRRRLSFAENLYGVPWMLQARALFCHRDVLNGAGALLPRTWDELLVAARRTHQPPDVYGFGLPGIDDDGGAEMLLNMLWAYGADLPPVEDPDALDREALVTTLALYRALHSAAEPEVLSWSQPALEKLFLEGRLAMLVAGRSFEEDIEASDADFDYAVAPLPAGAQPSGHISLDLACVFKGTAHRDAAISFVRALTSTGSCENLVEFGSLPFREDVIAARRADPAYAPYLAAIHSARGMPPRRWDAAREFLGDALFYLLSGRKTTEETVEFLRERLTAGEPLQPVRP